MGSRACSADLHVGIIMDGNGRWALAKGYQRTRGYVYGALKMSDVVRSAVSMNIDWLTLFAFSIDNWKRNHREVAEILRVIEQSLIDERSALISLGVRLRWLGSRDRLPLSLVNVLTECEAATSCNVTMTLTLCINYSGRWDIVQAARSLAMAPVIAEPIGEPDFEKHLPSAYLPKFDVIIRTSGEQRISNFLLWQSAECELWISSPLWPDFQLEELESVVLQARQRRERVWDECGRSL